MRPQRDLLVTQEFEQWRYLITPIDPAEQAAILAAAVYVRLVLQKLQSLHPVDAGLHIFGAAEAAAPTKRGR